MALSSIKPSAPRTVSAANLPAAPQQQALTQQAPEDAFVPGLKPTVKQLLELTKLEASPEFQRLDPSVRQQVLSSLHDGGVTPNKVATAKALISAPGFKSMAPENQKLALETLAKTGFNRFIGKSLERLVNAPSFNQAQKVDQTAMLSQAKNYPNTASIGNIERLSGKLWFASQSHEDKARTLKTIAYMSDPSRGDRTIINNTLEKILGPDAKFDIQWVDHQGRKAGHAVDSDTMQLDYSYATPDNGPGVQSKLDWVGNRTVPHEVNHLLSNYKVESSYKFVEDEYRGWYVGVQAQLGRPPTKAEAAAYFKNAYIDDMLGIYGGTASGVRHGKEAGKMFDLISKAIGVPVTDNETFYTSLTEYSKKGTGVRNEAAPPPPGNIDNR
ncbi:MAG: hypothetical protein JNK82_38650 [Myxococcaceae bacterium]|nr:hypothetical protein [Myxococcaceae bacterium]